MLKRIINVLLVSAVLAVGLTASVAMAQTPPNRDGCDEDPSPLICDKGQPGADEVKEAGQPTNLAGDNIANGFGAGTSQRASTVHDIGEHSSNPVTFGEDPEALPQDVDRDTPRDGVGNVGRTDGDLAGTINTIRDRLDPTNTEPDVVDQGPSPGAHACFITEFDDLIGQDPEGATDCTADPGLPGHPGGQPE